jgi:hypothetical protein
MATTLHVSNLLPDGSSQPPHMTLWNAEHFPAVGDLIEIPEGRFLVKERLFSFPATGDLDVLLMVLPFPDKPENESLGKAC